MTVGFDVETLLSGRQPSCSDEPGLDKIGRQYQTHRWVA